jgi:integrase
MELSGRTDLARDMFLVGCYTGLRFSDVVTLKQSDIKDGWVSKKTIKTGASVEIPTSLFDGKMEQIVAKYDGNIENLSCHHIGNSEANRLLKPLFTKLKMSDSITFHSSRHTFATLLSLRGVSLEIVQKMLGHSSATMTAIYDEARHDNRKELLEGLKCVLKKKQ